MEYFPKGIGLNWHRAHRNMEAGGPFKIKLESDWANLLSIFKRTKLAKAAHLCVWYMDDKHVFPVKKCRNLETAFFLVPTCRL